jgi:hypothetical protein
LRDRTEVTLFRALKFPACRFEIPASQRTVLLVVLTIVIDVIIAAAGRTAGQSQQYRGRDPDEYHASESEADRDTEGGQRQPDAKLKPVFDHVCLVLQTKRRRARVLGRNEPGD